VVQVGTEIIGESILPSMRGAVVDLARRHLALGDEVWIVTASPQELSQILAARLGLTGGLGTRAEVSDGRYTGRILGGILHGEAKAAAVRAMASERGIDLSRSSAYSDSINDLPLLNAVGFPNAVTPDRDLARKSRREGWPVHEVTAR
jgi:HAD superfamily hydrolase (TIGR01490 family)